MADWQAFFNAEVDRSEPIAHLRHALDNAFGYKAYEENEAKQSEVDDLATRKRTWERSHGLPPSTKRRSERPHATSKLPGVAHGRAGGTGGSDQGPGQDAGEPRRPHGVGGQAPEPNCSTPWVRDPGDVTGPATSRRTTNVTGQCEAVRSEIDALARSLRDEGPPVAGHDQRPGQD